MWCVNYIFKKLFFFLKVTKIEENIPEAMHAPRVLVWGSQFQGTVVVRKGEA